MSRLAYKLWFFGVAAMAFAVLAGVGLGAWLGRPEPEIRHETMCPTPEQWASVEVEVGR